MMAAMNVSEVMAPVKVRVLADTPLRQVAVSLRAARTGLALVDAEPEGGVLTERDVMRAVAEGADLDSCPAGDYMTPHPVAVEPTSSVQEACDLMIERGVRHLLVQSSGAIVGVLNMRDVVGVLSGAAPMGAVPPARGS
jgi:signal-transduction protein with cAMP-binding, CBS, and nucleotidyltransferase domain